MKADIIGRRLLIGAGALALTMPRAKADTPFSSFAFKATGTSSPRTLPDRLGEVKNVKDFGAVGNGSVDDTAAIQAAVNLAIGQYSSGNRGTVYFPAGTYRITAPVTFETSTMNIRFLGEPGARLLGGFADALLKRSYNSPIGGVHVIENLIIQNGHTAGKGVMLHSCVTAKVVNCQFSDGAIGIETYNSQCATLDTCTFIGHTNVGVMAGNATTVLNCDITGCGTGIRHQNIGLVVHGGRFEMNTIGLAIGFDENGNNFQTAGFDISGLSMEANQTGIRVGSGAAGKISACSISGGVSMAYGLHLISPQDVVVQGVSVGGSKGFTNAGVSIVGPTRTVLMGVGSNSPTAWALPSNQSQLTFIQTNKP
jgi:Pectate lyase superfamily protein